MKIINNIKLAQRYRFKLYTIAEYKDKDPLEQNKHILKEIDFIVMVDRKSFHKPMLKEYVIPI